MCYNKVQLETGDEKMTKFVKGFVCAEMTADGPRQFAVESEEVFDVYVELSEMGSDEAGAWGGFEFDLDPDDENTFDTDGEDLDKNELVQCQVITMAEINKSKDVHLKDIDDIEDMDGYDSPYEDAFLGVRDGDFRVE